jgi:CRISP-associated protein Cas1
LKKLQNSLYITRQETYVHKERETIVIKQGKEKLLQVPAHSVGALYCFGQVMVSPPLMGYCGESGIGLAFFSERGRFLGRLQGRQSGNVFLRKAQYQASEKSALEIGKLIVAAKIQSSRSVLRRRLRNHGPEQEVKKAVKHLGSCLRNVESFDSLDQVRGTEGDAAATYFRVFNYLILPEVQDEFTFEGRNRRPPRDPVNAMLSFLYAVIGQDISSALQGVGLDPQVGFLHADRPGRDSLAQDLLEEFRAYLADRLVLSLINRKQIKDKDFILEASGAVRMKDDARKTLLTSLQERKQEEISHPFLKEKVPIGLLPHVQAMLLARHLRGDLECYPPFLAR